MYEKLREDVFFSYQRELEYMAAAAGMFCERLDGHIIRNLLGDDFIEKAKNKNRELAELLNSLWLGGLELVEFIMSYPKEEIEREEYKNYILNLPLNQYLYQIFGYLASPEEVEKALQDDEALASLMDCQKFRISSFVSLKTIIFERERFLNMYFSFLDTLKTPGMEQYLDSCIKLVPHLKEDIVYKISQKKPHEAVHDLRNNCVWNPANFKEYGFFPVFLLPRDAALYYEKNLLTLYSLERIQNRQNSLAILRSISDETRLRIIDLLTERGAETGKIIASWMHLTPPTISHHMEQLVSCGIVKEERKGVTKYFSVDKKAASQMLQELRGLLLKNTD